MLFPRTLMDCACEELVLPVPFAVAETELLGAAAILMAMDNDMPPVGVSSILRAKGSLFTSPSGHARQGTHWLVMLPLEEALLVKALDQAAYRLASMVQLELTS